MTAAHEYKAALLSWLSFHSPRSVSATSNLVKKTIRLNTLLVVPWDTEIGGVSSVVKNLANYLVGHSHEVLLFHSDRNLLLKDRLMRTGFSGVQLRLNMPFGPKRHRVERALTFPFLFIASTLQLGWLMCKRHIRIIN